MNLLPAKGSAAATIALALAVLEAQGALPEEAEAATMTLLTAEGGRVDWSSDGEWIYYDRLEEDGFHDVYRIHPDGTANQCLTCDRVELPTRHKGNPAADPSGRYLVFQAETEEHPGGGRLIFTQPGGGLYNDLWVLDLQTNAFHQLTDIDPDIISGSLHAHFSHDGTRLLWTDIESVDNHQLSIAEFEDSPWPQLVNRKDYNPGPNPAWLESLSPMIPFCGSPISMIQTMWGIPRSPFTTTATRGVETGAILSYATAEGRSIISMKRR